MTKKSLSVSLLAALLLLGVTPSSASAQDAFQNLIPDDAMGLVYMRSMGGFQSELQAIVATLDEDAAEEIDIETILGMLDLAEIGLDMTKPACIVMAAPEDEFTPPTPVLIMPCKDAKESGDTINAMGFDQDAVVRGGYVAFSPEGMFKAGSKPNSLLANLPDTDLVIRIKLGGLIETYRADIDMVMDMMAEEVSAEAAAAGAGAAADSMIEFITEVIDSAHMMDITADMNGTAMDVSMALTVGQGTPMAKGGTTGTNGVAAAAGFLPASHPMSLAMNLDMKGMVEFMMPMWKEMAEEMPKEQSAAYMKLMDASAQMMGAMGGDISFSMGVGAGGFEVVQVYSLSDPASYMEFWRSMVSGDAASGMGMGFSVEDYKTDNGVSCQKVTMSMDWDKLMAINGIPEGMVDTEEMAGMMAMVFGGEDLVFHWGAVGKNMVMAMGGDTLFKQCIENPGKGPSAGMKKTLAKAGTSPGFAMDVDVRGIMKAAGMMAEKMGMGGQMPLPGDGPPVSVGVYAGRSGLVYSAGMHADVGELAKLLSPFIPR